MNVLSLFDGISCGQQAIKELDVQVGKYYASEIDKYAIAITQHNFPDTIQLGDVTNWRNWTIGFEGKHTICWEDIDLIQGGSPCQGFSFAGKQLNFDDPRSKLFFEFVDILNHARKYNPNVKFLLENVRMKQEYQDIISEALGVNPVMINSALVSAQNRVRLYWTNIGEIQQPEDKGILLRDVLEDLPAEHEIPQRVPEATKKGYCEPQDGDGLDLTFPNSKTRRGRLMKEKSNCLTAANYDYGVVVQGAADRNQVTKRGIERQINIRKDEKSNCVVPTYAEKLNRVCIQVGEADIKGHDSIKRVYSPDGKSPTLTTMGGGHREPKVEVREKSKCVRSSGRGSYDRHEWDSVGDKGTELHWRKFTPLECERLQTLPDGYTAIGADGKPISNTQRYKVLGNGWTVAVIKHIYQSLK